MPLDDPELREALKITVERARAEQAARAGAPDVAVDPAEASPIDRWVPENGAADLEFDLKGERGGPMKFRALLFPKGIEFVPEWLPLPIQGVIGRVEFGTLPPAGELADQGDRGFFLRLSDVRGRLSGAEIIASGRVFDGALQDLVVHGEEVTIDDRLLSALRERFRALSKNSGVSTGAWAERVLPEGKVTFSLRYRHPDRSPDPTVLPIRLSCHLSDSALMAPVGEGRRIDRLEADIEFDPNRRRLVVSDLSGRLETDRGGLSSDRLIVDLSSADGLRLSGDLVLDRVPFDAAITELIVNDGLRRFLSERGPSGGTVAIVMPRVILEIPTGKPARVLSHESRVIITDGTLSRPAIDRINGVIVIAGDLVDGQLQHDGAVSDLAMRVLRPVAPMAGTARSGLDVTDARASIRVRPGRVDIDEITGDVAGGTLPPANNRITILGGEDGVDGAILLDAASLRSVVGFVSEAKAEIDGRVRLELNFHGRTLAGINAHGLLSVDDGQLWELPVLSQVYRYTLGAALGSQSGPVFETGFVQYEVRDGRVFMQNLMLDAPVGPTVVGLKLLGSGEFDFQGNVRMRIDPQIISARIPIVSPVIDLLKRRLISYKVTGTFANPTIAYENPVGSLIGTLFPGTDEDLLERPRLPARGSLDWSKRF